jgi:hypothetical protein
MNTLDEKYNPIEVLTRYHKLVVTLYSFNLKLGFIDRIKAWYYRKVKYPFFRRYVSKAIVKNLVFSYQNPEFFVKSITQYIASMISFVNKSDESLHILLKSLFGDKVPIKINFMTDPIDSNKLIGYSIIVRSVSHLSNHYDKKLINIEMVADLVKSTCSITETVYNTDKEDTTINVPIIQVKSFDIKPNGSIYNPNYAFNTKLKEEEYAHYSYAMVMVLTPFCLFMEAVTRIKFVKLSDLIKDMEQQQS